MSSFSSPENTAPATSHRQDTPEIFDNLEAYYRKYPEFYDPNEIACEAKLDPAYSDADIQFLAANGIASYAFGGDRQSTPAR